jgi:hypothetical protein
MHAMVYQSHLVIRAWKKIACWSKSRRSSVVRRSEIASDHRPRTNDHLFARAVTGFRPVLAGKALLPRETSSMSAAIYNEDDSVERKLAAGAFLWPVRMML